MIASVLRISILSSTLFGTTFATAEDFTDSGLVDTSDVVATFTTEWSALGAADPRLKSLEDELRWMYVSLPKNSKGNLDHMATRYALHRFFLYRNGWHIRGLEPGQAHATSGEDWVPDFLQRMVESRVGSAGVGLQELAAFAAAVMDLAQKEANGRLMTAMEVHDVSRNESMGRAQVEQVLGTFYASFLKEGIFPTSAVEVEERKAKMAGSYPGWKESQSWISSLIDKDLGENQTGVVSFQAVAGMAGEIGEKYHDFNDGECTDLKAALRETESRKAGRVRLSAFYKLGKYSHWNFNEKAEYLRDLGALDESDPKQAYVIIPNYVMALNNCLDASHLFSVCCRNTCEDLMQHVEREVGTEAAAPERIAELVAALPSESVQAPRTLSSGLLARLGEVAAHHGGVVPLHGRLFAQWMHHAYPMECPYPHEVGSTNPQFAENWMKTSGESSTAPEHVIRQVVEEDTCSIDEHGRPLCDGETEDLQWTVTEERFASVAAARPAEPQVGGRFGFAMILLLSSVGSLVAWRVHFRRLGAAKREDEKLCGGLPCFEACAGKGDKDQVVGITVAPGPLAAVSCLALLCFLLDLLDGRIFGLAVLCSGFFMTMQLMVADKQALSAKDVEAKLAAKCCV